MFPSWILRHYCNWFSGNWSLGYHFILFPSEFADCMLMIIFFNYMSLYSVWRFCACSTHVFSHHRNSDQPCPLPKEFWPIPLSPKGILTNPALSQINSDQSCPLPKEFWPLLLSPKGILINPDLSQRNSDQSCQLMQKFWPILQLFSDLMLPHLPFKSTESSLPMVLITLLTKIFASDSGNRSEKWKVSDNIHWKTHLYCLIGKLWFWLTPDTWSPVFIQNRSINYEKSTVCVSVNMTFTHSDQWIW